MLRQREAEAKHTANEERRNRNLVKMKLLRPLLLFHQFFFRRLLLDLKSQNSELEFASMASVRDDLQLECFTLRPNFRHLLFMS